MRDTVIYLIRHGETEYNRLDRIQGRGIDAPLNAMGEHQARQVGRWLEQQGIYAICSSSLLRARQTAAIAMGVDVDEIPFLADLDELSYGAMEGIPVDEQRGDLAELYATWTRGELSVSPPGGESPLEVLDRATSALRILLEEHPGEKIAVVTHGRVIRVLIAGLTDMGLSRMQDIQHTNGCIYSLRHSEGRFILETDFQTDHLTEPQPHV